MSSIHPLAQMIVSEIAGRHTTADGRWTRMQRWNNRVEGIVAFTGHAVLAIDESIDDCDLAHLLIDGYGGAHHPRVITELAGPHGWIDTLDLIFGRRGTGTTSALVERPDLWDHPRASLARDLRDGVATFGLADPTRGALVTLGTGIGGLPEISFELEPSHRGKGEAGRLIAHAVDLVAADQAVLAVASPGNVASVRALLACGFKPIGSVQLFRRSTELSRDA